MPRQTEPPIGKWVSVVSKLLELTQSRRVTWRVSTDTSKLPADEKVTHSYTTRYLDQFIRIYSYQYKHFVNEDEFYWSDGVKLEFTDAGGRSLYTIPGVAGLSDLLAAVQFQTAGIDTFLDKILEEGEQGEEEKEPS